MNSVPLAVVILSHNEEFNLPDCLESLKGLDCSITVVDSGSTDRTIEIARSYNALVLSHPFENYSKQRNWAQANLPFDSVWILHLDADERLTPGLVTEINGIVHSPVQTADGFLLRKRTVFLGRWIRHGAHYPSFHLRLFRRSTGQCEEKLYDQHFITSGTTRRLENDYYDIIASNLGVWTSRHGRWAELEVQETFASFKNVAGVEPKLFGNPIERKRWLRNIYCRAPLFVRPFAYWAYRYLFRLGFLDGTEGLIFHFLQGFWFRFLVDSMIFEHRQTHPAAELTRAVQPAIASAPPSSYENNVVATAPGLYKSASNAR